MDARLKRKWLKALRSGEYRQGQNQLVSDNGENFCCLGVLADVMGCAWGESPHPNSSTLVPFLPRAKKPLAYNGRDFLNQKKVGLSDDFQSDLVDMNDGGASFKRIANFIEKNL